MCGRYALHADLETLQSRFGAEVSERGLWEWMPRYNISPGMVVPVIAWNGRRERTVVPMRWGLHPHWKKEPPGGRPLFNARVETAADKASFRTPFRRRRALIPLNGWYEWDRVSTPKTPYYIFQKDASLSALIGLWDQWRVDEGISLLTMTILTTSANGGIKHLHHRMGVRLPESEWEDWLNWDKNPSQILNHIKSGEDLEFHEVSSVVNSGRAEGVDLITPKEAEL